MTPTVLFPAREDHAMSDGGVKIPELGLAAPGSTPGEPRGLKAWTAASSSPNPNLACAFGVLFASAVWAFAWWLV